MCAIHLKTPLDQRACKLVDVVCIDPEKVIALIQVDTFIPLLHSGMFFHAGDGLVRISNDADPLCLRRNAVDFALHPNGRVGFFDDHLPRKHGHDLQIRKCHPNENPVFQVVENHILCDGVERIWIQAEGWFPGSPRFGLNTGATSSHPSNEHKFILYMERCSTESRTPVDVVIENKTIQG